MPDDSSLVSYYSARAAEYEKVYAKPERQDDLRQLHGIVADHFSGRHVLDLACGTGYWTRIGARRAASVTGCDLSPQVLTVARAKQPKGDPVTFAIGDAFDLREVAGEFDAAFVGFWWSHMRRDAVESFLRGLHRRVSAGSRVLVVDNRYVEGSNWPVTRTDDEGNAYQGRQLDDGTAYEVLKNFPSPPEVRAAILSAGGSALAMHELRYYWYAAYDVPSGT